MLRRRHIRALSRGARRQDAGVSAHGSCALCDQQLVAHLSMPCKIYPLRILHTWSHTQYTHNPMDSALEALLTEVARVRLHGFSDGEFSRAVKSMEAQVCDCIICTVSPDVGLRRGPQLYGVSEGEFSRAVKSMEAQVRACTHCSTHASFCNQQFYAAPAASQRPHAVVTIAPSKCATFQSPHSVSVIVVL